jgi:DNA-binding NtrC family response regulator
MIFLMEDERPSPIAEVAGAPNRCQATTSNRIFVVDDDAVLRLLSVAVLVRAGYEVDTAEDGQVAWEMLQANDYDLLITDNNMPRLSGVELVKRLRYDDVHIPIILVSGAMPIEELKREPWLQLAATLAKPFAYEELVRLVNKVLRPTTRSGRSRRQYAEAANHRQLVLPAA